VRALSRYSDEILTLGLQFEEAGWGLCIVPHIVAATNLEKEVTVHTASSIAIGKSVPNAVTSVETDSGYSSVNVTPDWRILGSTRDGFAIASGRITAK
jgi:hypothetical protein